MLQRPEIKVETVCDQTQTFSILDLKMSFQYLRAGTYEFKAAFADIKLLPK